MRFFFPKPPVLHLAMYMTNWRDRLRIAVERSGKKHSVIAMEASVDPATLSRILNGRMQPNFETMIRIMNAVDEDLGWLADSHGFYLSVEEQRLMRKVARILEDASRGRMKARQRLQPNAAAAGNADLPHVAKARGARLVYEASGDSMVGAGVYDRDILYVKPTRSTREATGRVVVCRLDGAEYVKVLDVRGGRMSLLSRNDRYPPIDVDEERFELIGVVVGRFGTVG